MKILKIIVCCDKNYGIGKNGTLPWNDKNEMKIFKNKTIHKKNNCVIMGLNTYKSIPDKYLPLVDRHNCVLSTTLNKKYNNKISVFNKTLELFEFINNTNYDEYWIMGGAKIYNFFMENYINLIYEIHISFMKNNYNCDTFFPKIDFNQFIEKDKTEYDTFIHYIFRNNTYS
tara:strand:+ start:511 stop:1026 length:516 start_codon:yes stop_codon:yes gene_type:complete